MRARGIEFEKPTVEIRKFDLMDLNPNKLRLIANLLEKDPQYQRLGWLLYSAEGQRHFTNTTGRYFASLEDRVNRVLQLLTSPNPSELVR